MTTTLGKIKYDINLRAETSSFLEKKRALRHWQIKTIKLITYVTKFEEQYKLNLDLRCQEWF